MKVVILAPSHRSFISKYLPQCDESLLPEGYSGAPFIGLLIGEFLHRGIEVIAITTTPSCEADSSVKEFTNSMFKWIVIPARKHAFRFNGRKFGRMIDFFSIERSLLKVAVKAQQADFIHAHWSYEFAGCLKGINTPQLVTVHDNAFEVLRYNANIYRFLRLVMSEYILRDVRFASTVSPYMEKYVKNRCRAVKVIPNPTSLNMESVDVYKSISDKAKCLNSPTLIMVMNGWDKRKNGSTALAAFKLISTEFPNAKLSVVGQGAESDGPASAHAKSLKMKNVTFHGQVSHSALISQINGSHFLIHPSREESFGVVLIEAMAQGVPPIGGKTSGAVPWVINNGKLLTDIQSPVEIKRTIVNLINNDSEYRDISLECYYNTLNRFSKTNVADLYIKYYSKIIQEWSQC